jgi:hypothetical protein
MFARVIGALSAATLFHVVTGLSSADEPRGLVLERVMSLGGVSGRIDHLAVDLERKRLAIAELGNDSVDIVDLASGRVVHRIGGLHEPQGVSFIEAAGLLAVANGGDGSVGFFQAGDFSAAGNVDLGEDADNLRVDNKTGHLFVGYGDGGLAVLDGATRSKLADIALQAHPEGFQIAPDGTRAFVNLPGARQVASVDLASGKQTVAWRVPHLQSNFPMALDGQGRMLAIAFRNPARLVLLDARNGAVTANVDTCDDADDVFFDGHRHRVYVVCGAGAVDVFQANDRDLQPVARVKTSPGARTGLFVPELDRLFVAARAAAAGADAGILVFRPSP